MSVKYVKFFIFFIISFFYSAVLHADYDTDKKECEKEQKTNNETNFCMDFFNNEKINKLDKTEKYYFSTLKKEYLTTSNYDCPNCKDMAKNLTEAEKSWNDYMDSACTVVYDRLDGGDYNKLYCGLCYIRLYKEHINDLWYLYMKPFDQNDQPLLPKPELK